MNFDGLLLKWKFRI